jgi:PmbA protein
VSLRCLYGQRQASVSGADLDVDSLKALADRCAKMAEIAPEDPYCGIVPSSALASNIPEFDLTGDEDATPEHLEAEALEAEAAALSLSGIQQVSSCGAGWNRGRRWVAASNGFSAYRTGGGSSVGLAAVGEKDGAMETDSASRYSRRRIDRLAPAEIGKLAAERTLARLGATKVGSQTAPVIFDRRVSSSLLNAFIGAISGPAIARGVSFLKDQLGTCVFAEGVSIYDDPFRPRGLGTRGHDGEGLPVSKKALIENGTLTGWLLNSAAARQLNLEPNGFSGTSFGDPPGIATSNVYMEAGKQTPSELMQTTGKGLIVTSMFGPSINPNSGDYSVGVSGMWYENGEIAYPVSEVTIASDLPTMFARLIPANDLELLGSRDAPSLLIEGMTIAGS